MNFLFADPKIHIPQGRYVLNDSLGIGNDIDLAVEICIRQGVGPHHGQKAIFFGIKTNSIIDGHQEPTLLPDKPIVRVHDIWVVPDEDFLVLVRDPHLDCVFVVIIIDRGEDFFNCALGDVLLDISGKLSKCVIGINDLSDRLLLNTDLDDAVKRVLNCR